MTLQDVILKATMRSSSKSPAATGEVKLRPLGTTASGKKIMSHPQAEEHSNFTQKDHADAYRAHANAITTFNPHASHPSILAHHKQALLHHWKGMVGDEVKKARHHGKTRSGKKIYHSKHGAHHPSYKDWSEDDHSDAAHHHHGKLMSLVDRLGSAKTEAHAKLYKYLIDQHGHAVHSHHRKSHKKKRSK